MLGNIKVKIQYFYVQIRISVYVLIGETNKMSDFWGIGHMGL